MSVKEKVLLIGAIVTALLVIIGGSVYYLTRPQEPLIIVDSTIAANQPKKEVTQKNIPSLDASIETLATDTESTQPTAHTPSDMGQHSQNAISVAQPQTSMQKNCNESMKASYTYLYNLKITDENTRWANLMNSFTNEADSRNKSKIGLLQEKVAQAKTRHAATIEAIEQDYLSSLTSVNCN